MLTPDDRMARQYQGSRVLIQNHVGHGSLFPVNFCMWSYVKLYVQFGVLPEEGTVCDFPCVPFETGCDMPATPQMSVTV
jgi:hypothetical protein